MKETTAIIEKRKELQTKRDILAEVFKQSGAERDFSKVKKFGETDTSAWAKDVWPKKIEDANTELTDLRKALDSLISVEKAADQVNQLGEVKKGDRPGEPKGEDDKDNAPKFKSIGDAIVDSKHFKTGLQQGRKYILEDSGVGQFKADFLRSAGWLPETMRTGRLVELPLKPIMLVDIVPSGQTQQASVDWMEETTRTEAAAERAEAAAYAEAAFELTERKQTVETIGVAIPVSDEQLADEPRARSYLNNRLPTAVRRRIDGQILNGNGNTPNIEGILGKTGLLTQVKVAAEHVTDAIYKAMTKIEVDGLSFASHAVIHPTNWQDVRLMQDTDGRYIWGHPSMPGPEMIWGVPVVKSQQIAVNTALMGGFTEHTELVERQGIELALGYVASQFTTGMQTIRCGMRVVLAIYRIKAFCTATSLEN